MRKPKWRVTFDASDSLEFRSLNSARRAIYNHLENSGVHGMSEDWLWTEPNTVWFNNREVVRLSFNV